MHTKETLTDSLRPELVSAIRDFRRQYETDTDVTYQPQEPHFLYYGDEILEKAVCAILGGKNLLLAGPKATGKNVLAENLAWLFGRPAWNVSFHINADASFLIGTDTFDGEKVVFRPGPVLQSAKTGGFCILDEINMAKNEAMAVLHSALDHRRILEVSGYERTVVHPAARFIGTMNYGYAGTRELNEALCSRFMVLQMPTITEEQLYHLLTREYPDIPAHIRSSLIEIFYELDEKASNAEVSSRAVDLRGLLDSAALMKLGLSPLEALDMGITNKVFDSVEREIIHDVIAARIPDSWDDTETNFLKDLRDKNKKIPADSTENEKNQGSNRSSLFGKKAASPLHSAKKSEKGEKTNPDNRKNPDSWMR